MAKSKSSSRWLQEHFDDPYVKLAQKEGHRSRAVYKLIEIQEKYRFIRPGMNVVDLGAAPGGWSEIAVKWVGKKGHVYALDILEMTPITGVTVICGDFTEDSALHELEAALEGSEVDVVLSDMSPNMSGMRSVDQPKSMALVELAYEFAKDHMKKGGYFVTKIFHGEGFDAFIKALRTDFKKVVVFKPKASRDRSREVYAIGIEKNK